MASPQSKAYLALLLAVFVAAAVVAGGGAVGWRPGGGGGGGGGDEWHKPGFCGKMDCPRFTVWQASATGGHWTRVLEWVTVCVPAQSDLFGVDHVIAHAGCAATT